MKGLVLSVHSFSFSKMNLNGAEGKIDKTKKSKKVKRKKKKRGFKALNETGIKTFFKIRYNLTKL